MITAVALVVTVLLVTVAVALVFPTATVTLAGAVATAVLLLESATTAPPDGAAPDRLIVACELLPPVTELGVRMIEDKDAGGSAFLVIKTVALRIVSRKAEMVTEVSAVTANVVTVKVAEVCPEGTVTIPGTVAAPELLVESVTDVPPAGAGALKTTVPVAAVPPGTLDGVMLTDCSNGGAFGSAVTVMKMDFVTPPAVAKMFPPVGRPVTGLVVMVKLTALFPSGIATVAGT